MLKVVTLGAIFSGFLAVLLGAFGAHALKGMVPPQLIVTWKTASFYHFVHTLILLIIITKHSAKPYASQQLARLSIGFFVGMLLFSGSLYLYVLSQITVFAMITPIGGLCLLFSWAYWFKIEFFEVGIKALN